ncbi:MAG: hypothetical protein WAM94_08935 [Chromatiaceae bacterium]
MAVIRHDDKGQALHRPLVPQTHHLVYKDPSEPEILKHRSAVRYHGGDMVRTPRLGKPASAQIIARRGVPPFRLSLSMRSSMFS